MCNVQRNVLLIALHCHFAFPLDNTYTPRDIGDSGVAIAIAIADCRRVACCQLPEFAVAASCLKAKRATES
jgi:hypothetical protein